jgi:hypothetical protein
MELVINAEYDGEARVWVACNDEIGLAIEADTIEVLTYKLQEIIPELVELNGLDYPRPVPFTLIVRRPTVAFA